MPSAVELDGGNRVLKKLQEINWGLVFLVCMISCIGFAALYSAAGGDYHPWAYRQMVRFAIGFIIMISIALIDVRWWYKFSWAIYIFGFLSLIYVEFAGQVGMGAQRWINIGGINIQPSEFMKIAIIMVLSRYFHNASLEDMARWRYLIIPALLIGAPVALVMLQPDLGTALMMCVAGGAMFFIAGAPMILFIGIIVLGALSVPVAWQFLHEYQKKRVMTFLDPSSDPLGSGYHITQSKIALGSGGVEGKGFLNGTQSHLNFLPEKQTDFIFTLWSEEWGLLGGLTIIGLFALIFIYGAIISSKSRNNYGRYLSLGLTINLSLYVFINIGMVMGLLPVVGAPLPMISYGGTSMIAALTAFGLMLSSSIYRDSKVTRV
ncbi:MAG: rod shape-determining protein RodA [Pseudomonadota bacterium]